jgi:hypothetical protein
MNYHKIYQDLIKKCTQRTLSSDQYFEKHHIIPKCIGGSDDTINLVKMLPEEHLIAHLLLVKIHPNNPQLIYAANWMTSRVKNNKEYGWVKRQFAKVERDTKLGIPRDKTSINKQKKTIAKKYANGYVSPIRGRHITDNHKKERTATLEHYVRKFGIDEGTRRFNEYVNKQSVRMKGEANPFRGKKHSAEARAKISQSNTGKNKIRTIEHNQKIGQANKGRKQEIITCPHCEKSGGLNNMKRWHFDKCPLSCDTSLQ